MKALVFSLTLFLAVLVNSQAVSASSIFNHPNPQSAANFGAAVAAVGPVLVGTTLCPAGLLIGAPRQDVGANVDQGQAYLVCGNTGALLLTLNNPSPQNDSRFGAAVASAGDIDGDGENDLFVGAPRQNVGLCGGGDTGGCSVGQAFVFSSATGALLWTLNLPSPLNSSFFGSSVASISDLNADTIPDLIVGSPGHGDGSATRPSQAFVFSGADGALLLTIADPNPLVAETVIGFTFGSVVASIGDVNGDLKPDILVGDAQQDVGGNADQGQVHIFSGSTGTLIQTLNHPDSQAGAFFGVSVASIGDIDNDLVPDIVVGAYKYDVGLNEDQGRAYVFSGASGALLLTLDNPTPQAFANFGFSAAGAGNINNDAVPDIVISAPGQTLPGPPGQIGPNYSQGQAFVFSGATGALLSTLDDPSPQRGANFGHAVVSGGDLDGDGKPDVVVGAPFQDVVNPDQGQVSSPVATGNQAPIANAGPDQSVNEGALVNLNGSSSSDPDLDPLTFLWTQTAGPAVTLSNPASVTPTFTAPQVSVDTVLTFQLVVNDGLVNSSPDTVNITVLNANVNQAPVANAGPDQTVNEGAVVTLNGTGSSDPNLDPITFLWSQTAGPTVTLSNSTSATPTFTAPQVSASTVLTFQLTVSDGTLSSSDTVSITVLDVICGVDFLGTISKLTRKTSKGKDNLSFTLDIFNAGTAESRGSFKVKFYISNDATLGSGDTLVFTKTLKDKESEGRIKPGNTVSVSGSVSVSSPTQGKYLIAHIDADNNICESNESNNHAVRQIP